MVKLLVVDDEVEICDFVKNFFKERDFEVFVAYDGKEALGIIEARNPDIVLLDVKMPEMDGIETLKAIRKHNSSAKVIMVTAVEDAEKAEEAKSHGAIEYITKPLLLEQLERTVLTVAEQIKMER
ncbi:MAG: response regulator [Candidatus Tantalella remota]|nr:response regulator [Candidatus Tantalella remota]